MLCYIIIKYKTVNCEFRYLAESCFTLKKTLFTLASKHNTSTLYCRKVYTLFINKLQIFHQQVPILVYYNNNNKI